MSDAGQLIAWLREAADELEKAHMVLDGYEVPRSLPGSDVECTLAARIGLLIDRAEGFSEALGSALGFVSYFAQEEGDEQAQEICEQGRIALLGGGRRSS